tara:strand:+ start:450 stop:1001 length:552 start_codon:yes stop_codon:yes gene_type:complete
MDFESLSELIFPLILAAVYFINSKASKSKKEETPRPKPRKKDIANDQTPNVAATDIQEEIKKLIQARKQQARNLKSENELASEQPPVVKHSNNEAEVSNRNIREQEVEEVFQEDIEHISELIPTVGFSQQTHKRSPIPLGVSIRSQLKGKPHLTKQAFLFTEIIGTPVGLRGDNGEMKPLWRS